MTNDEEGDFTEHVLDWLSEEHELSEDAALPMVAGLMTGLALAARHPGYARTAHIVLSEDYRDRAAGSTLLFEAMALASGDERTSPEKLADELTQVCPLAT